MFQYFLAFTNHLRVAPFIVMLITPNITQLIISTRLHQIRFFTFLRLLTPLIQILCSTQVSGPERRLCVCVLGVSTAFVTTEILANARGDQMSELAVRAGEDGSCGWSVAEWRIRGLFVEPAFIATGFGTDFMAGTGTFRDDFITAGAISSLQIVKIGGR